MAISSTRIPLCLDVTLLYINPMSETTPRGITVVCEHFEVVVAVAAIKEICVHIISLPVGLLPSRQTAVCDSELTIADIGLGCDCIAVTCICGALGFRLRQSWITFLWARAVVPLFNVHPIDTSAPYSPAVRSTRRTQQQNSQQHIAHAQESDHLARPKFNTPQDQ
jgi:hypothetical protein